MLNSKINTKTVLLLITLTSSLILNGCGKKDSNSNSENGTSAPETVGSTSGAAGGTKDEGASSGGGGYVTKNSKKILELVVGDLSKEIRRASPFLFKDLPKGWTQEKFADVLGNIRMNSTKDIQRDNSDLLFNYGTDEKGPYIEALRPFFTVYGHIPYTFLEMYKTENFNKSSEFENLESNLKATILDLKLKVLHEVSHHFGKDEKQAETFSLDLLRKLERDFYICMVPREEITQVPNVLWISPIGKKSDVPDQPINGSEPSIVGIPNIPGISGFGNSVNQNGWIYHQSKDSLFPSNSPESNSSHLDPQPLEGLKEVWEKDKSVPGLLWKKYFANQLTLSKVESSDKNVSEFTEVQDNSSKQLTIGLSTPIESPLGPKKTESAPFDPNVPNAILPEVPEMPGIPAIDFPTIKLEPTKVKIQFESGRVFKSATVSVPEVEITPKQTEGKSSHGNPSAKVGEPTGRTVVLPLKCDYVGVTN